MKSQGPLGTLQKPALLTPNLKQFTIGKNELNLNSSIPVYMMETEFTWHEMN